MSASSFSKRNRQAASQLVYDNINDTLRVQIVEILKSISNNLEKTFSEQDKKIDKDYPFPLFKPSPRHFGSMPLVFQFIAHGELDACLDAIEYCFKRVNQLTRSARSVQLAPNDKGLDIASKLLTNYLLDIERQPDPGSENAISELNRRFREHDVGYQFSSDEDQLVRTDSHYLHRECVDPAMRLLACPGFEGPAQEFAKAHQHYRNGEDKAAVQEATKALESTIKAICHARNWVPKENATLMPLLKFVFEQELIPKSLDSSFAGLRTALESGLPTIGNREARHGQGKDVKAIERHMVEFALHLCAASIVFLVKAHLAPTVATVTRSPPTQK